MTTGRDLNPHRQQQHQHSSQQQSQQPNQELRSMHRSSQSRPAYQASPNQYHHGDQSSYQQSHSYERANGQRLSGMSMGSSGVQLVDHNMVDPMQQRRNDGISNSKEKPPISAQLLLPILIRPILLKIERRDRVAAEKMKIALMQAENRSPGIIYDLVLSLSKKCTSTSYNNDQRLGSNNQSAVSSQSPRSSPMLSINLIESLLRLQGVVPELEEFKVRRPEEAFQDLNRKAIMLKKILSRIPDEISDRRTFLETIKEIASAIKKLLDVVNTIQSGASLGGMHPATPLSQQDIAIIERRKRDFIKYSKSFSDTLKNFFRDGSAQSVFVSACQLILQTNAIQVAIKGRVEGLKNAAGDGSSAYHQRPNQNAINAMNQIMDEMRL